MYNSGPALLGIEGTGMYGSRQCLLDATTWMHAQSNMSSNYNWKRLNYSWFYGMSCTQYRVNSE